MTIAEEMKDIETTMKDAMRVGKWQLIAPDGRLYQAADAREIVAILFREFNGIDINNTWDISVSPNT